MHDPPYPTLQTWSHNAWTVWLDDMVDVKAGPGYEATEKQYTPVEPTGATNLFTDLFTNLLTNLLTDLLTNLFLRRNVYTVRDDTVATFMRILQGTATRSMDMFTEIFLLGHSSPVLLPNVKPVEAEDEIPGNSIVYNADEGHGVAFIYAAAKAICEALYQIDDKRIWRNHPASPRTITNMSRKTKGLRLSIYNQTASLPQRHFEAWNSAKGHILETSVVIAFSNKPFKGIFNPVWKAAFTLLLFSLLPVVRAVDPDTPISPHTLRTTLPNLWTTGAGIVLGAYAAFMLHTRDRLQREIEVEGREIIEAETIVSPPAPSRIKIPWIENSVLSGFLMGSLACAWVLIYPNPKTTYWLLWSILLAWGFFTTTFGVVEFQKRDLGRFSLLAALLLTMFLLAVNPTLQKDGVIGASTWLPFSLSFSLFVVVNIPILVEHVKDMWAWVRKKLSAALRACPNGASENSSDDVELGHGIAVDSAAATS